MADAVATQILLEGDRKVIMKFTNLSDGTGNVLFSTLDASSGDAYTIILEMVKSYT